MQLLIVLSTTDCTSLVGVLRNVLQGCVCVIIVNEAGEVIDAPPDFTMQRSLSDLIGLWRCDAAEYDKRIGPGELERFPLFGAIVPVVPEKLSIPFVRNATVHCADAARVCGDKFCVLLRHRMKDEDAELEKVAGDDKHLYEALRQMGLEFEISALHFDAIADSLKNFMARRTGFEQQIRRQRRLEHIGKLLIRLSRLLQRAGELAAVATAGTLVFFQGDPPVSVPWQFFVATYTALWGMFVSAIPTRAAFPVLEQDRDWNWRRHTSYRAPLLLHGGFLMWFYAKGYFSTIQIPAVLVGLCLGILTQALSGYVYRPRILLQSLSAGYSSRCPHLVELPRSAQSDHIADIVAPHLPRLPKEYDRWDALASRIGIISRDFYCPSPSVFISYTWRNDADIHFAEQFKQILDAKGISAFLDRERITRGATWRAIIAESLHTSTHFVFIVSPTSITAPTCAEEIRFVLEILGINTRPSLSVCVLEEPDRDAFTGEDPVFSYVWERAFKVKAATLLTPGGLQAWLKQNRPSSWLSDVFKIRTRRFGDGTRPR